MIVAHCQCITAQEVLTTAQLSGAYRMARRACRRAAATRALLAAAAAAACASWLQLATNGPPMSMPKLPPKAPMQMPLLAAAK